MVSDNKNAAYLIVSNIRVEKVWIISENNGMFTVKLSSTGGAIRVSTKRLYTTKEEAEAILKERKGDTVAVDTAKETKEFIPEIKEMFHSPHYYGWY